ncbi:MAG: hypothetical protein BZ137_04255 [Methanosphaera sp. rholeuAM130]|nr:MAG: hypothetical protein BZ137_04255 [Methanosphaera sp. rholeuAM130]
MKLMSLNGSKRLQISGCLFWLVMLNLRRRFKIRLLLCQAVIHFNVMNDMQAMIFSQLVN